MVKSQLKMKYFLISINSYRARKMTIKPPHRLDTTTRQLNQTEGPGLYSNSIAHLEKKSRYLSIKGCMCVILLPDRQ